MPLFVDLEGRLCVIIGGGRVATARARTLLDHGAALRVVSPRITSALNEMSTAHLISDLRLRPFDPSDLDGCLLAVAATDSPEVNGQVAAQARTRGVLCNAVADPAQGDVVVPSLVRRGELAIAATTGGASPAVAAHVRAQIERTFGPEWDDLLDLLRMVREPLKVAHPDARERSAAVRRLFDTPVLDQLAAGRQGEARATVAAVLGVEVPKP